MKKTKIRTIEIDVDGVIFDIWPTFFTNEHFKYASEARRLNFTANDFNDFACSGLNTEQHTLIEEAFKDVNFMTNLNISSCVSDSICLLKSMFEHKQIDCIVINTTVSNEEIAYLRKLQLTALFSALKQYNFLISVFVNTEKADFACDVLIEDNLSRLEKTIQRHKLNFLIDAPYNQLCSYPTIQRYNNLYTALKSLHICYTKGSK